MPDLPQDRRPGEIPGILLNAWPGSGGVEFPADAAWPVCGVPQREISRRDVHAVPCLPYGPNPAAGLTDAFAGRRDAPVRGRGFGFATVISPHTVLSTNEADVIHIDAVCDISY